jgi:diacylglycerol kinase (ATP)
MLCGSEFDRNGMVCIWCQRSVHLKCRNYVEKECDFGRYSKSILPPACVKFPPLAVSALPSYVSPILVFINPKSGGQTGLMALMAFNSLLNPVQVINCLDNPREHLKNLSSLKRVRILVAGGDGSVSWMLKLLYDDDIWPGEKPPVGIFPMGTGNDLSNVLNWGVGLRSQASENLWSLTEYAGRMIKDLYLSHVTLLDRWNVTIESASFRSVRNI